MSLAAAPGAQPIPVATAVADVLANRAQWHVEQTDVLAGLAQLPDGCVSCVVTSPPYWNLRDYQVVGQLGSEKTLDCLGWATGSRCGVCYICCLTAVFAEVKRVLRPDGTCFLNVGDSYQSGGARRGGAYGTSDKEPEGSLGRDCLCGSLCDACRRAYQIGKSHSDSLPAPTPEPSPSAPNLGHRESSPGHLPTWGSDYQEGHNVDAKPGPLLGGARVDATSLDARESNTGESSRQHPASCLPAGSRGDECQLCGRSLPDSAQASSHRAACTCGTKQRASASRRKGKDAVDVAYPYYTTASQPKPKDLMLQPARLALSLQASGWWVRSQVIWHKPNCMPESCQDRPTSSHETIWLLSKRATYFFDAVAVREENAEGAVERFGKNPRMTRGEKYRGSDGQSAAALQDYAPEWLPNGRNARNVWTIPTEAFSSGVSYGTHRIESPDCPVHGYQVVPASSPECGERSDASLTAHSQHSGAGPSLTREGAAVATSADQFSFLSDATAAKSHSTQSRRMAAESTPDESAADKSDFRTAYTEPQSRSIATSGHMPLSSIGAGGAANESCLRRVEQTHGRSEGTEIPVAPVALPERVARDDEPRIAASSISVGSVSGGQSSEKAFHRKDIDTSLASSSPDQCTCKYTVKAQKAQDHFAVFPTEIPRRAIAAGSSQRGVCPTCGAPWTRVIERGALIHTSHHRLTQPIKRDEGDQSAWSRAGGKVETVTPNAYRETTTTGWAPGCNHAEEPIGALVLDCFSGAATSGLVALRLGRRYIGLELSPAYCEMSRKRIMEDSPMLNGVYVPPDAAERQAALWSD